jgi:phosphoribosylamine---glycine ligase
VRVLVVGSGGREHALAWKIAQSPRLEELHAAPGNPGIAQLGSCHPVRAEDGDGVLALARSLRVDLVVVGPEAPLVAGLADRLRRGGVPVFGPSAASARIEGSKAFAKEMLERAGVPTARALPVARPPCVVKADGLATGKGVFVCMDDDELQAALAEVRALGTRVLIEELLEGEELSVFAVCDGRRAVPLAAARDFKRARDGDAGPNTGGMGAFSPVPGSPLIDRLVAEIHRPVLAELAARDAPFSGLLYAGLMLTADGPRVLEFNCRFGDPETQAVLPLISSDLLPVLAEAAAGDLGSSPVELSGDAAVTVVMAAKDYPASGDSGSPIAGIEEATELGALVFHAATAERDHTLVTSGGRILGVTGVGPDFAAARELAYAAVERISFTGARYRRDIGAQELLSD